MPFVDSPGRSISNAECVWIFDLDETILSINSFPFWVRFMMADPSSPTHLRGFAAMIMAAKKCRLMSHGTAKYKLQHYWRDAFPNGNAAFNEQLRTMVRPSMSAMLARVASGEQPAILATAAAECYAVPFARSLGFTHIIATQYTSPKENRAERKRDSTLALLEAQNWSEKKRIFFTDHIEDMPLMHACQKNCWFGEKADMPQEVGLRVLPCAELSAQELFGLVSNI